MRTQNLFKVLALLVAMFAFGSILNAQTTAKSYAPVAALTNGTMVDSVGMPVNDVTEYVTVGSKMPYAVRKDANIGLLIGSGVYAPSVFYLNISNGAFAGSRSVADFDVTDTLGAALSLSAAPLALAAQTAFPYTLDSAYMVYWKTTGNRTVMMDEYPVTATAGLTTCEGPKSLLQVSVINKPTVDWVDNLAAATGPWTVSSCGNATSSVLVNINGFGDTYVVYDSSYFGLNGVNQGINGTDSTLSTGAFGAIVARNNVTLTEWNGTRDHLNGILAGAAIRYGYVEYTIKYVNDLISRKSMAKHLVTPYGCVAGGTNTTPTTGTDPVFAANTEAGANMPAHIYRIYNLPTPSARPIKHVTNLGW